MKFVGLRLEEVTIEKIKMEASKTGHNFSSWLRWKIEGIKELKEKGKLKQEHR